MMEQLLETLAFSREKKLLVSLPLPRFLAPFGDRRTRSLSTHSAPEDKTRPTQYFWPLTFRTFASNHAPGTLLPQHQISTAYEEHWFVKVCKLYLNTINHKDLQLWKSTKSTKIIRIETWTRIGRVRTYHHRSGRFWFEGPGRWSILVGHGVPTHPTVSPSQGNGSCNVGRHSYPPR